MHYYHATFFTNRDSILEHGLVRNKKRIWRASDARYNYLTGTEEDAINWMIDWYRTEMYDIIYSKPEWKKPDRLISEDDIRLSIPSIPRINDGLAVFAIDPDPRFKFREREDRNGVTDHVTKHDIPPEYIQLVRYVSSEEVVESVLGRSGVRLRFFGLR